MKKILSYLLLFPIGSMLISCHVEKSLPPSVLLELEGVERSMFEASAAGDSAAFRKLCGLDYFTIDANGEGHTLEETIPNVPRFKGSMSHLSEQRQRVFGNFVVRNGRVKYYLEGRHVAELLYSAGWVYRDDRWQFVHWQGTLSGMMLEKVKGIVSLEPPPAK